MNDLYLSYIIYYIHDEPAAGTSGNKQASKVSECTVRSHGGKAATANSIKRHLKILTTKISLLFLARLSCLCISLTLLHCWPPYDTSRGAAPPAASDCDLAIFSLH